MNNLKLKLMKLKLKMSNNNFGKNLLTMKANYPLTFWSLIVALLLILFMFFTITLPGMKILGIIVWKNLGWLILCSAVLVFDVFLYEKPKNCEYDSKSRQGWYIAWILYTTAIIAILCFYGNFVQSLWS